jgi:hypothetical protein
LKDLKCVVNFSVYGIGAIVPGKGAIVVQGMSNKNARNKGLQMTFADVSPQERYP